ncbi:hypothetical protein [Vibrio sp. FF145]|uniref:hypothetical protein n=1 Tax=Vibrio sp. FF145 TaxID=3230013 RepID=UPI00352C82E6
MKQGVILLAVAALSGCTTVSQTYEGLGLDTTSSFSKPSEGKAGVYVYQYKTGIFGSYADVDFELKQGNRTVKEIALNTGEYGYFEVDPGGYSYKFNGGLFPQFADVKFLPNENHFFRGSILQGADFIIFDTNQNEINQAKFNIMRGRYELNTID